MRLFLTERQRRLNLPQMQVVQIDSTKCPRCHKTWGHHHFHGVVRYCDQCQIRHSNVGSRDEQICWNVTSCSVVIWWVDSKTTEYIIDGNEPNVDQPTEVESVYLPWLPFDITIEQLKIFAAFS